MTRQQTLPHHHQPELYQILTRNFRILFFPVVGRHCNTTVTTFKNPLRSGYRGRSGIHSFSGRDKVRTAETILQLIQGEICLSSPLYYRTPLIGCSLFNPMSDGLLAKFTFLSASRVSESEENTRSKQPERLPVSDDADGPEKFGPQLIVYGYYSCLRY